MGGWKEGKCMPLESLCNVLMAARYRSSSIQHTIPFASSPYTIQSRALVDEVSYPVPRKHPTTTVLLKPSIRHDKSSHVYLPLIAQTDLKMLLLCRVRSDRHDELWKWWMMLMMQIDANWCYKVREDVTKSDIKHMLSQKSSTRSLIKSIDRQFVNKTYFVQTPGLLNQRWIVTRRQKAYKIAYVLFFCMTYIAK
jgi:hypothetical protein